MCLPGRAHCWLLALACATLSALVQSQGGVQEEILAELQRLRVEVARLQQKAESQAKEENVVQADFGGKTVFSGTAGRVIHLAGQQGHLGNVPYVGIPGSGPTGLGGAQYVGTRGPGFGAQGVPPLGIEPGVFGGGAGGLYPENSRNVGMPGVRADSGGVRSFAAPAAEQPLPAKDIEAIQNSLGDLSRGEHELRSRVGALGGATSSQADGCMTHPLFASLHSTLQKLALLEQDPVEASFQIHEKWEADPSLFDVCPVGLITALVYLSIAQEQDWKYRLLHRATYLLYSSPSMARKMQAGRWPMSDRLIRTMYHNSEVMGRTPLSIDSPEAQPMPVGLNLNPDIDEAVAFSMQHQNRLTVHFKRVLFYHFYHVEQSPCACRTRSWCLPKWVRHFTNTSVDIWLAARDERKTLYRMDRSGCFRSLDKGLTTHYFSEQFDAVFVFEINALMHAHCRILPAKRMMLYPTFELSPEQIANFDDLGVSVLPDDALMKPPNPKFRKLLEQAVETRIAKTARPKDRLLLFPADIRPMKGQLDFLELLLFEGARSPSAVQRLKGVTIVIAGTCDGNQTYCQEVVSLTRQVNAEDLINIVIADTLTDDELSQLYAASLGVVMNSRVDCNPRAVYEGLVADCPFFVTEKARLPHFIHHLGLIVPNTDSTVERLAEFVEFAEAGGFSGRPGIFAKTSLVEADVYYRVVQWMDQQYVGGKVLDPVIRSEDALSGALAAGGGAGLGGLSAVLGGLGRANSNFGGLMGDSPNDYGRR